MHSRTKGERTESTKQIACQGMRKGVNKHVYATVLVIPGRFLAPQNTIDDYTMHVPTPNIGLVPPSLKLSNVIHNRLSLNLRAPGEGR